MMRRVPLMPPSRARWRRWRVLNGGPAALPLRPLAGAGKHASVLQAPAAHLAGWHKGFSSNEAKQYRSVYNVS